MLLALVAFISMVVLFVGAQNWRMGIIGVLLVGVLQDPFRKLTPGVPSYYLLWAAVIFGIIVLGALPRMRLRVLPTLSLFNPGLRTAWEIFIAVILLQAFHALVRWGSPLLPVLGLMFYLSPIVALVVGFSFAPNERWLRRFLFGYVAVVVPAALTVYLSVDYSDQWDILKDIGIFVGKEMKIYDVGTVLASHPGIFRVGEIAGWHAGTAAMFLFILYSRDTSAFKKAVMVLLVIALVGAILLTGRRKMLAALTIFVFAQAVILAYFHRGAWRQTVLLVALGLGGTVTIGALDPTSQESLYVERGSSVYGATEGRLATTIQLLQSALSRSSGIGLGAGTSAQGAQHVGGQLREAGAAGEAGISKILLELGLPGLFAMLLLIYRLATTHFRAMRILAVMDDRLLYYAASFAAFFVANAATFFVASQVYGDVFVLIVLGISAGMMFSVQLQGLQRFVAASTQPAAIPVPA